MSGVYFIAAGQSSRNREKSLDKILPVENILKLLSAEARRKFIRHFATVDSVYAWGANRIGDLNKLEPGDFVVDVKNKKVIQVFQFGCWIETQDTRLQEYIGWDSEKPKDKRRPYKIVYFLIYPMRTKRNGKDFFQRAFAQEKNQNWLVGQRWFDPIDIQKAMERTYSTSIEDFLGINTGTKMQPSVAEEPTIEKAPEKESFMHPSWLGKVISQIEELRNDTHHQERDHEDLVSRFFEELGYERGSEIKYRRGRVDVLIQRNDKPLIVIEVKRDWSLTSESKDVVQQAFNYALDVGSRYVAITNGDRYAIYDRTQGMSYAEHLVAEFQLTRLKPECVESINKLRPKVLTTIGLA